MSAVAWTARCKGLWRCRRSQIPVRGTSSALLPGVATGRLHRLEEMIGNSSRPPPGLPARYCRIRWMVRLEGARPSSALPVRWLSEKTSQLAMEVGWYRRGSRDLPNRKQMTSLVHSTVNSGLRPGCQQLRFEGRWTTRLRGRQANSAWRLGSVRRDRCVAELCYTGHWNLCTWRDRHCLAVHLRRFYCPGPHAGDKESCHLYAYWIHTEWWTHRRSIPDRPGGAWEGLLPLPLLA